MTLAYKFKDVDKQTRKIIEREIDILNMIIEKQTINISKPTLCYFNDMTKFIPIQPYNI